MGMWYLAISLLIWIWLINFWKCHITWERINLYEEFALEMCYSSLANLKSLRNCVVTKPLNVDRWVQQSFIIWYMCVIGFQKLSESHATNADECKAYSAERRDNTKSKICGLSNKGNNYLGVDVIPLISLRHFENQLLLPENFKKTWGNMHRAGKQNTKNMIEVS